MVLRRRFGRSVFLAAIGPRQRQLLLEFFVLGCLLVNFVLEFFKLGVDLDGILAELRGIFIQKLGLMNQLEDEVAIRASGKVFKGRSLVRKRRNGGRCIRMPEAVFSNCS